MFSVCHIFQSSQPVKPEEVKPVGTDGMEMMLGDLQGLRSKQDTLSADMNKLNK